MRGLKCLHYLRLIQRDSLIHLATQAPARGKVHKYGLPGGKGALLSGDIVQVGWDRKVSFMRSYPNLIPERPRTIRRALTLVEPLAFDRICGAWWRRVVGSDGAAAVCRSAERYLRFALDDDDS